MTWEKKMRPEQIPPLPMGPEAGGRGDLTRCIGGTVGVRVDVIPLNGAAVGERSDSWPLAAAA